jgi:hypothetical protein
VAIFLSALEASRSILVGGAHAYVCDHLMWNTLGP